MSLTHTPDSVAAGTTPAVSLFEITKHYGRFAALRGVNADFTPGKLYVILGENGAGKSTLLRMIAGCWNLRGAKLTRAGF